MFGHLKAEEFMNEIEGVALCGDRRAHVNSCRVCAQKLDSMRNVHDAVAMEDSGIPEPDWNDFRESIRRGLLARSVKRESAVRRWIGWSIRPAMAWGLSLVLLICISAGGFLWHVSKDAGKRSTAPVLPQQALSAADPADMETEVAAWGQTGLFEDLSSLQGPEVEQVRQALLAAVQNQKLEPQ